MGVRRSPNLHARLLARTLRVLREEVGMKQEEAAAKLRFSKAKISRIETGQIPEYHAFRAMLDLYGLPVSDWGEYLDLREQAEEKGWWHAYGQDDRGFISIEAAASRVRVFQFGFVPGLLQTEAYMREVFVSARRPLEGEKLRNAVAVRLRRQRRLVEEPLLRYHAIIDEIALRPRVCVGEAHQDQLRMIIERARLPNVTVQVVPGSTGAYDCQFGCLLLASFPSPGDSDMAYVEHMLGSVHMDSEAQVGVATLAFRDLADRALDAQDSLALLERL